MSKYWLCCALLATTGCGGRLDLGTEAFPFSGAGRPADELGLPGGFGGGGSSGGGSSGSGAGGSVPETTAHDGAPSIALCSEDPQSPAGLSIEEACAAGETSIYHPSSDADFVASFVGSWLACNSPSIFGTTELGIEINQGGTWAKLFRDGACSWRRGTGFDDTGDWVIEPVQGKPASQLYFHVAGGGGLGGDATVALPNKLRLTSDTLLSPTDYAFYGSAPR